MYRSGVGEVIPSTMPKPERRMGTREMVPGVMVLVWNSKPRGVWSCGGRISAENGLGERERDEEELTNSWARSTLEFLGQRFAAQNQRNVVYQRLDVPGWRVL